MEQGYTFGRRDYYTKYNKNIIDLIELGDLVNGYLVNAVEIIGTKQKWVQIKIDRHRRLDDGELGFVILYNKEIKTILTKEQIQQNQYVVEE